MRTLPNPLVFLVLLAGCASDVPVSPAPHVGRHRTAAHADVYPDVIRLPNGFFPEGIAFGRGATLYVGSIATGAIFRGDARTGAGDLLVPPQPGREAIGVKYDQRRDWLFVAGGLTGQAYLYEASTGAALAMFQLADLTAGPTEVNDVTVLRDAAYFTDDARPVIYRIALGADGAVPSAAQTIPLTGDFQFIPGAFNANGIVATPDGSELIIVNTTTGSLYRVDAANGHATEIDLIGGDVVAGDGLLLAGQTLYVVQGYFNQIAVVRLSPDFASGVVERTITSDALAFPTTVAAFGSSLYAVNARLDVAPGPHVEYEVVRLTR